MVVTGGHHASPHFLYSDALVALRVECLALLTRLSATLYQHREAVGRGTLNKRTAATTKDERSRVRRRAEETGLGQRD